MRLDTGKMADEHAMPVQRAFRLPGRAGGVDHHRRVVGGCVNRAEMRGSACQCFGKAKRAVTSTVKREDQLELTQAISDLRNTFGTASIGDQCGRARIL